MAMCCSAFGPLNTVLLTRSARQAVWRGRSLRAGHDQYQLRQSAIFSGFTQYGRLCHALAISVHDRLHRWSSYH